MSMAADKPNTGQPKCSVEQQLFADPCAFDFFQAVSLLEKRQSAERTPGTPAAKFATPASTAFPASAIEALEHGESPAEPPRMTVNFMGLTGPSGVLPRHYTELLVQIESRLRDATKRTLGAWYDLFSNRFVAQFFRGWAKCRIDRGVADGRAELVKPDAFTGSLYSLIGLGQARLRDRLSVADANGTVRDRVRDPALVRHAGLLSGRRRPAREVAAMLSDYFQAPITILQFQGQWLELAACDRSRIGVNGAANRLGVDCVLGQRVWDRQSRVRVRVGPLCGERFKEFLPAVNDADARPRFVSLCQMVRLAIGSELDFDVQLVLREQDAPRLEARTEQPAARLGWNSWLSAGPLGRDGDDPVFEPIES
ncbi:hypothetical protein Pla123a_31160 [Posidoniimonas polymericola]|uniref:Type VI secretion protein n=1 Tax=Posidoniimonas polymericola TaxID=2528002 RepID=A0A5C5YL57_9BACT|nr:type VI secretion system baseplate subunit TssG [Posidoniimonas polymericola]TWT75606.1 hypothetical protein Pla123a_31160 [Posidoniimonas polymericola]